MIFFIKQDYFFISYNYHEIGGVVPPVLTKGRKIPKICPLKNRCADFDPANKNINN